MEYRAYPVGNDGHLQSPEVLETDSDAAAIEQVKKMLNGLPIELWQGARMVGWFQNTSQGLAAVTPPAEAKQPSSDSSPPTSKARA